VETVELPEIEELSERFLKTITTMVSWRSNSNGSADGKYKLLDVNARTWGFHSIGSACGVDFPYLLFADQLGLSTEQVRAKAGVGWLRLLTDIQRVIGSRAWSLSLGAYFRSLRATRVEAVFSWKDPFPSLAEMVLLPYLVAKKLPSIST